MLGIAVLLVLLHLKVEVGLVVLGGGVLVDKLNLVGNLKVKSMGKLMDSSKFLQALLLCIGL